MANGFVCAQCGWQQTVHRTGVGLSEEEKAALNSPKEGYTVAFWECNGYVPTEEESVSDARQANFDEGQHEGQH